VLFSLVTKRQHIYRAIKGEAKKYEAFLLNFKKLINEAFSVAMELEYFVLFTQVDRPNTGE
jgi:hypothetical protein